ncbi:MAG: 16S rRNA (uracil(1498)-N(3))-methyltransferase [Chromatiales bacterium]|jgi:16S rRNA (uracil1498-N3)-methyltransferase
MRVPWIHAAGPLTPTAVVNLPQAPSRHLAQVLRLAPGHPLVLFDGEGAQAEARIAAVARGRVDVEVIAVTAAPPPPLELTLAQGIARAERMDYALQKAVELGVSALVPLFTERCVVRLDGPRLVRRMAHWEGLVVAACEQSHRPRLPRIEPPRGLRSWVAGASGPAILLDPQADTALPDLPPPERALTLLVGPEGGLSEREIAQATDHGFRRVRLGPRVLRTETAPVAAVAAIQALWGDFR